MEVSQESLINFHRVIAQCKGITVLIFILAIVEDLLHNTIDLLRSDNRFFRAVFKAHTRIYDALVNRNAESVFFRIRPFLPEKRGAAAYHHGDHIPLCRALFNHSGDWAYPRCSLSRDYSLFTQDRLWPLDEEGWPPSG
jgi:hypothetical protein